MGICGWRALRASIGKEREGEARTKIAMDPPLMKATSTSVTISLTS